MAKPNSRKPQVPKPRPVASPGAPEKPLPTLYEASAGGVVIARRNKEFHVPIIARVNRAGRLEWCLPKGHPEGSEDFASAAVREIAEETGIHSEVIEFLGTVNYWFSTAECKIYKTVHHFLLRDLGGELSIDNDPDREAVDVTWAPLSQLKNQLAFPNERQIADLAIKRIQEL